MGDSYRPQDRASGARDRGPEYDERDYHRQRGDRYTTNDSQRRGSKYDDADTQHRHSHEGRRDHEHRSRSHRPRAPRRDAHEEHSQSDLMRYEAQHAPLANTGDKDVGSNENPLKFLLIRDLKPSITDELLSKALEKLYAGANDCPGGATQLSLRRILSIKKRDTDAKTSYAFAEYHSVEAAIAAKQKSLQLGRQCTVSSQRFQVDFPHAGVFPDNSIPGSTGVTPKPFLIYMKNSDRAHRYYDERYYAAEFIVNQDPPEANRSVEEASSGTDKATTGSKRRSDALGSAASRSKKTMKYTAPAAIPELQKWQNKQAELRAEITESSEASPRPAVDKLTAGISSVPKQEQTFAIDQDDKRNCYLCNTTFAASNKLMRHLQESATHALYAKDDSRRYRGFERMKKKEIDPSTTVKLQAPRRGSDDITATLQKEPTLQWRDRAAERRQGELPSGPPKMSFSLKPTASDTKGDHATSESEVMRPVYGKGLGMLQKAGWTEGQGLGAGEGGIAVPIAQEMYAAGVGLGHQASRKGDAVETAARLTKDPADFQEMTRENARKRYESMQ